MQGEELINVKPTCLTIFREFRPAKPKHDVQPETHYTGLLSGAELASLQLQARTGETPANLENNHHRGEMSRQAKKKVNYAVNLLQLIAEKKKVFQKSKSKFFTCTVQLITLTLPAPQGNISDKEITKKALNQFLVEARATWQMRHYVWKAERQKNGNIHYHIATDAFIPWYVVRTIWNRQMKKLGFIDQFRRKHGHTNAPTEEIRKVRAVKNLSAYMSKYLTKDDLKGEPISGRLWSCSRSLSTQKKLTDYLDPEILSDVRSLIRRFKRRYVKEDFFTCVFIKPADLLSNKIPALSGLFKKFLKEITDKDPPAQGTYVLN